MNIAIIGAGAAGLAAAKNLGAATPSPCLRRYRASLVFGRLTRARHANRSTRNSGRTFPLTSWPFGTSRSMRMTKPASTGDFPEAEAVRAYLARYADHFNLAPLIQFDRRVVSVEKASDGWQALLDTNKISCFDAVGGHYHQPFFPAVPGLEDFHGRATHSANFVRGVDHRKETVVIWGGHASGTDLVGLIAPHAKRVFWSGHGAHDGRSNQ